MSVHNNILTLLVRIQFNSISNPQLFGNNCLGLIMTNNFDTHNCIRFNSTQH